MGYKHLSSEERYYIETRLKMGDSLNTIASSLQRNQSTLSREVKRNTGLRGYRHKQAQAFAQKRLEDKPKQRKITGATVDYICYGLKENWSPEQIAGRAGKDGLFKMHHQTIYNFIRKDKRLGGLLYRYLPRKLKPYRKKYGSSGGSCKGIPGRIGIEDRPTIVDTRARIGDWEADTIIGKGHQGAIATIDERKSKLRLAMPVQKKTTENVVGALISLLLPLKKHVKTITFDNGREFASHQNLSKKIKCDNYFAKPYSSWERGQNENANGLLRRYFPKTMSLKNVKNQEVIEAVDRLNSRPRKCLNYQTAYEAFEAETKISRKQLLGYALKI
ncbi:IS30 family transposase [Pelagibaculum spongiae]|uniref:IS30 family transposase n=1 Tax=Pelagibaculum spongiae TaxID=2080658 RepID=A0A2V1GZH6_9GAMM|nr:IS30 family transposase [Pelagibaculum spongiae]PVZ68395.1 IS30 family transposase [Pelagibaculum spongiae]